MKIKRILATYIDIFLIAIPCDGIIKLFGIFIKSKTAITIITIPIFALFIFLLNRKDCIFGYESIGKKLMRLKIYQNDTRVTDKELLIKRNKESLNNFPQYGLAIFCEGKSDGDIKFNTEVK